MRKRALGWAAALAVVALAAGAWLSDTPSAVACSCARPESQLWSPLDKQQAPLNASITLALSTRTSGKLVLRPIGGEAVPYSEVRMPAGWQQIAVLTPKKPLQPDTRYEVAFVERPDHPRTLIFGTFKTGTHSDDKAPDLAPPKRAVFHDETVARGTSCQSHERWIDIELPAAKDERDGRVLYGLWVADKQGKLDLKAPPLVLEPRRDNADKLTFGATSMCFPRKLQLPAGPRRLPIAVAAFDNAGHRSAVHRTWVQVPKGQP